MLFFFFYYFWFVFWLGAFRQRDYRLVFFDFCLLQAAEFSPVFALQVIEVWESVVKPIISRPFLRTFRMDFVQSGIPMHLHLSTRVQGGLVV